MVGRGNASSVHFGLQRSRSTEVAVDGPVAAPAQRLVAHPGEGSIAVASAPMQTEFPEAGNEHGSDYGGTDDGGSGRAAGSDWSSFRARQFQTASETSWATGAGDVSTAPTEHGAWFDAPLGDDGGDSARTCTDSVGQTPGGPPGATETRFIVNPIRPATPPRMQRLEHGHIQSSSVGGGGNGPTASGRLHSGFDRGGEFLARQSDSGWAGSKVGQDGGQVSECGGTGIVEAADTESAQLGETIAKKLDFHDVFLDPV